MCDDDSASCPTTDPMTPDSPPSHSSQTSASLTSPAVDASSASTATDFRLGAKKIFLTFPQCDTTKEIALERIIAHFGTTLDWTVIAQETHADGNFHLHLGISLRTKLESRDPHVLDWITMKHGSYEGMRNVKKSLEYFHKSDPTPLCHGINAKAVMNKKNGRSDIVAQELLDGKSIDDITEEYPGFTMINLSKLTHFIQFVDKKRKHDALETRIPLYETNNITHADQVIVEWLNKNIRRTRHFKQPQLWIYSTEPNMGKTSFINFLNEHLSIHHLMKWEDFDDMYQDNCYDLIVIDEFEGQRKLGWMNELLQGGTMPLRRKGEQYIKNQNLPILIASNQTPSICYQNCTTSRITTLLTRLKVINIEHFIEISVTWSPQDLTTIQ